MSTGKFEAGQIVATPGVLALGIDSVTLLALLWRHLNGDWGDLDIVDANVNNQALVEGGRLVSVYSVSDSVTIWIVTEQDRSTTTLLLPSEY